MSTLSYKTQTHVFGPNETIRAVIRKLNHQGMSNQMLDSLVAEFNVVNGDRVPKPGQTFEIPIFMGFVGSGDEDKMSR